VSGCGAAHQIENQGTSLDAWAEGLPCLLAKFGEGKVVAVEGTTLAIAFHDAGRSGAGMGERVVTEALRIPSPKRSRKAQRGWDGFFPYYAGFPEPFAREMILRSELENSSLVFDPWNGSGTTTYSASMLGLSSVGFDLNPVMVIVAKARLLAASEADSIRPLGNKIVERAKGLFKLATRDDPLMAWFGYGNAGVLRSLEASIREHLVGSPTFFGEPINLSKLSSLAAANYVALFSVCRDMTTRFKSTNPTWLRFPRLEEGKVHFSNEAIQKRYLTKLKEMAGALEACKDLPVSERALADVRIADSTRTDLPADSVDLILTSPPYCTRIDYTAATRVELALLSPIANIRADELGRQMIGSTRVPLNEINVSSDWGTTCTSFLTELRQHRSKASGGYYYRTHLDYFYKMNRSIGKISGFLKRQRNAIFVVQDSYYKELYNDLPQIITEVCEQAGLVLQYRKNFHISRTLAGVHPYARAYAKSAGATEAVLCFKKL